MLSRKSTDRGSFRFFKFLFFTPTDCKWSIREARNFLTGKVKLVGWRDVPKQCVPVRMYCDPWSPKSIVPETQCPWINTSLYLSAWYNTYMWSKWHGCINPGTLCHNGQLIWGPRAPESSYRDTSFRDVPSPHRKIHFKNLSQKSYLIFPCVSPWE